MQIITARRLIAGQGKAVWENAALCMEGGLIKAAGPADLVRDQYPNAPVCDYGEATILPGLIDMHIHVGDTQSRPDVAQGGQLTKILFAAWELSQALKRGITTVRDVASEPGVCAALRQAADMGFLKIPRIVTCGTALAASGGHGWPLKSVEEVDGPWKIREAVRRNIREGADWIKAMADETADMPEYTQEELDALVQECHRHGKKAAVHASFASTVDMCIKAGFDTIEHGIFLTPQQARAMAQKGIAWVPTAAVCTRIAREREQMMADRGLAAADLTAGNVEVFLAAQRANPAADVRGLTAEQLERVLFYRKVCDAYAHNLKPCLDMGVTILAGTDMVIGGTEPAPVEEEIICLTEYGLTAVEAVESATGHAARVLGLEGQIGTLEPGAAADILVVEGDAARRPEALRKTLAVYQNGNQIAQ